ncbi:BAG family molecular chaperone regulator 2 [Eurytemora carolleeae]|uniref:BAG family molecular chaperone regulator 2 n=1 Tax=Eurytemora carolleeae TaxID=1294199 RepID=UPI000C75EF1D|nr:BAG family molecular chaperone regulator 2 [Eurytemora carolleeae]|eukprot:XP_023328018.1 BAG family molecular chaperone regulator 2-like [Eurytemora affinis]
MGGTNENTPAAEAGGVEVTSVETAQLVTDSLELTVSVTQISNISPSPLENIRELLDEVEEQVEKVRVDACQLQEEKEDIQTTLEMLMDPQILGQLKEIDREEMEAVINRLSLRLNSVNVNVQTPRSHTQQESLHQVNSAIDTLIIQIQTDTMQASMKCRQYLSAAGTDISAPSDVRFEAHLLGCAVEDQKNVKKRLLGLFDHIKAIASECIQEDDQ